MSDDERRKISSSTICAAQILRSVSRSFYLSIRMLPPDAARSDCAGLSSCACDGHDCGYCGVERGGARGENRRVLAGAIQGSSRAAERHDSFNSFAPLQKNDAERALIEELPDCLDWLEQHAVADRTIFERVWRKSIVVSRWMFSASPKPAQISALQNCGRTRGVHISRRRMRGRILDADLLSPSAEIFS